MYTSPLKAPCPVTTAPAAGGIPTGPYDPAAFADVFAMRAAGGGLEPYVKHGDDLVFDKTAQIEEGQIVALFLNERQRKIWGQDAIVCRLRQPWPGTREQLPRYGGWEVICVDFIAPNSDHLFWHGWLRGVHPCVSHRLPSVSER